MDAKKRLKNGGTKKLTNIFKNKKLFVLQKENGQSMDDTIPKKRPAEKKLHDQKIVKLISQSLGEFEKHFIKFFLLIKTAKIEKTENNDLFLWEFLK